MKLFEIIDFLETIAPLSLQESYDNAGLIVGSGQEEITKALVCLDAVEAVVDEAIAKGAQLIIAHHPIVFSGLKKLNGKNYVERTVIKAIKNNIAIYAIHTNLDNVIDGVNARFAQKLNLQNTQILAPKSQQLVKLVTFVPKESKALVLEALFAAGAGEIGNYNEASFSTEGFGSFKGNEQSQPRIGQKGERTLVEESRLEVILEQFKLGRIMSALFSAHPYEEVAYDLIPLNNQHQSIGSGMIGNLTEALPIEEFFSILKAQFSLKIIRHTSLVKKKVLRVALCGGAGSFLLPYAKTQNADVYISADFKYHEFFDADNQLVIADIGHYESEQFTSELLIEKLNKKFRNFAFLLTETDTNPVKYFI